VTALPWPELLERLQAAGLEVTKGPDREGWYWARCIRPSNHAHQDNDPSLRVNVKNGAAKCMTHSCVAGNLNDVAKAMDVSVYEEEPPAAQKPRTPSLEELATNRMLPAELLRFYDFRPVKNGWTYPVDDPDGAGFERVKQLPGARPKYLWSSKGVRASELVYGLSRVDAAMTSVLVTAGEIDCIVASHAGYPAVSFLAGENAAPAVRAIEKVKARLPDLKTVIIIYDLDAAGREGARRVADRFLAAGVATELVALPDFLPEDGDINDLWKHCEADRERFTEALDACILESAHLEPVSPRVEQLDFNRFTVDVPAMGGYVRFGFDGIERRGRDLSAEVTTRIIDVAGFPKDVLTPSNLNLGSLSGRDDLKKELERVFGGTLDWPQQINRAIGLVREAWMNYSPLVDLFDVEERPLEYLIGTEEQGFAPLGDPTVLFGDGGVSKTQIGVDALIAVAYGHAFQGLRTIQMPVLMVDAEANQGTIRNRASRRLQALGIEWDRSLLHYWPANGRSLPDQAEAIRREVRQRSIGFVLYDSVTLLCNGEPEKADQARTYFQALGYIGTSSISVAHVTNDASRATEQKRPFGSAFWHNSARATWNVQRVQDEGERTMHVGLFNRKMNDDALMHPIGLQVTFDGKHGPIYITREDVAAVPELAKGMKLPARLLHVLKGGWQSIEELTEACFPEATAEAETRRLRNSVKSRLYEMRRQGKVVQYSLDGKWGLPTQRVQESA
jgi:hypothetical protein